MGTSHSQLSINTVFLERNVRGEWRNDLQCAFRTIRSPARFAELLAHAQNTTMCLKHTFELLASGLDLGLPEMVETRGLDHIQTITENAAKIAESESKRNVKRIENRKAKDSKRELVL